ncbi:DUF4190 domain-containing protein [Streptomyces sp. CT34]|uniref:DUF4190 domain-containing protein n=1 Tax=Streptomyces sp. CT34 TaxID=1553907 RepID=UPI0005BBAA75|nr:DUF4190 domain-containing protein [Streptomyces sp. CT34]
MTAPVSPDGSPTGDPLPQHRDPWAAPPAEGGAYQAPCPPLAWTPQPSNGMGITALVLGIVGVVLGVFIFLFWLSWLPALLAVIFGGVGLSRVRMGRATNRAMALSGVGLGILGLLVAACSAVFTAVLVKDVVDDARAHVKKVDADARAKAKAAEEARHLSFGKAYTFDNGLKVTVGKPVPFVPDGYVLGHAKGNKAVQVTVTVVNTGSKRVAVETGLPSVNDADGASAELVIDGSGRQKVITGYVLPGKEAVGKYAFSLPPEAANRIEVEFSPDAKRWQDAYWSGPTS